MRYRYIFYCSIVLVGMHTLATLYLSSHTLPNAVPAPAFVPTTTTPSSPLDPVSDTADTETPCITDGDESRQVCGNVVSGDVLKPPQASPVLGNESRFLASAITPFDNGFANMKDFLKYSLHNVAMINNTLHFYGISSAFQKAEFERQRKVSSEWKLNMQGTFGAFHWEWIAHEEPLDKEWCQQDGTWVEEDVFIMHPFQTNNFYHMFNNNLIPLFYNVLFSRPDILNASHILPGRARNRQVYFEQIEQLKHRTETLYQIPRRVYRIDYPYLFRGQSIRQKELAMYGCLDGLFCGGGSCVAGRDAAASPTTTAADDTDQTPTTWYHSASDAFDHKIVCMKHLRWGEALRPFEGSSFPFHEQWKPVIRLFVDYVRSVYQVPYRSTVSQSNKPNIVFVTRKCGGGDRCIVNKQDLISQLEAEFSGQISVVQCCDYANVKETLHTLHNADILIGKHGANLAGLLFMKPGGLVVEIKGFKARKGNAMYRYQSYQVGLAYVDITVGDLAYHQQDIPLTREEIRMIAEKTKTSWLSRKTLEYVPDSRIKGSIHPVNPAPSIPGSLKGIQVPDYTKVRRTRA